DLLGPWIRELRYFWFRETSLGDIPLVVCRSGWSKQGGFELFLQDGSRGDELYERVKSAGSPYGIGPGAPNHVERVESGLLSWGGDTTPDSNPYEAGMSAFVDVELSPDYIGKQALRQVVAMGPRRLLTGLMMEGEAPSEWPLVQRVPVTAAGEVVGTMSAVVHSHRLARTIAIAQVRRDIVEAGGAVEVASPDGARRARIHPLPFIS
ncbi:MAG: glycine cleavage system protein T, partial [Actinobacteria bacterium]|nr:glycine cleavage system protein T [Actinomycetota bacterium]